MLSTQKSLSYQIHRPFIAADVEDTSIIPPSGSVEVRRTYH